MEENDLKIRHACRPNAMEISPRFSRLYRSDFRAMMSDYNPHVAVFCIGGAAFFMKKFENIKFGSLDSFGPFFVYFTAIDCTLFEVEIIALGRAEHS